jgi:hypothetical protein
MSKDAPCMKLCRRVCGILIAIKTEITPWYFPLFGRGRWGNFQAKDMTGKSILKICRLIETGNRQTSGKSKGRKTAD